MAAKVSSLPRLAPYPEPAWRKHLSTTEWDACLDAWTSIAGAHLSYSTSDFQRFSLRDESLSHFLESYMSETVSSTEVFAFSDGSKMQLLRKQCFLLSYKLIDSVPPLESTIKWEYLANLSKVYARRQGGKILSMAFRRHSALIETDLNVLRSRLIKELDAGLKGDLKWTEMQLKKLNHFLHASPDAAAFFMAGSDFLDSLISCYKIMNPPLRKTIISTTYLCLVGLTEDPKPQISTLIDQLYSLEAAAKTHKEGPTNVNDSLVAELVTVTPILNHVRQRISLSETGPGRASSVLLSLQSFKKAGGSQKPLKRTSRRIDKGKARADAASNDELSQNRHGDIHVHRMSLISQVQDLFPDLGSGFVMKLLDEYKENVEVVISYLLEDSLPPHLREADRSEGL
jgi:activating signal cointegrator complex subunit 2